MKLQAIKRQNLWCVCDSFQKFGKMWVLACKCVTTLIVNPEYYWVKKITLRSIMSLLAKKAFSKGLFSDNFSMASAFCLNNLLCFFKLSRASYRKAATPAPKRKAERLVTREVLSSIKFFNVWVLEWNLVKLGSFGSHENHFPNIFLKSWFQLGRHST